jgi:NADH-ubiquinone oxidoreductase chain 2
MLIYNLSFLIFILAGILQKDRSISVSRTSLNIISFTLISSISLIDFIILKRGIGIINGLFINTSIIQFFKLFCMMLSLIILFLTSFFPRKLSTDSIIEEKKIKYTNLDILYNNILSKNPENINVNKIISKKFEANYFNKSIILNKKSEQFTLLEYTLIIIMILIGVLFLLSTCDFVSLFICLELQSYGLYILCALYKNSELSVTAALTYFLLGALASCFVLLGTGFLYSNSGNFYLDGLQIITSI